MYPRVEISLSKIKDNAEKLSNACKDNGLSMWAVTKCFCAIPEVAEAIVEGGASMLADSRVDNLKKLEGIKTEKVLLRIPMQSEASEIVKYADYSQNSEISTVRILGEEAVKAGKVHNIIVMVDLGDLREGLWPDKVDEFVSEAVKVKGISIKGFGVNLSCYGGVMPEEENLSKLAHIAEEMADRYKLKLEIVSGGNSSSFYLVQNKKMVKGINNLRLGEVLLLGRETAYGNAVEGLNQDVFVLKGQIVELKEKPSLPIGTIGMDAFGNVPVFEDRGIIKRAIVAMGRQDIDPSGITPIDKDIQILGGSSDHTILDVTKTEREYHTGDIVEFLMDYGSLLRASTSPYVKKVVVK